MLFTSISIVTLLLCFLLGFYVYLGDKNNNVNKSFILICIGAMLWIFTNLMTDISNDIDLIKLWSKATMVGPIFFGYFFYKLSIYFPRDKNKKEVKILDYILLLIMCIFFVLIPTSLNIIDVHIAVNGLREVVPGPLYIFALIYFCYLCVLGVKNIFSGYKSLNNLEKQQVQYVTTGIVVSVFLGIITNVILPIFNYSKLVNIGPYFLLIFIIFTSYAVIRYKMFDIKIIVTQLLIYLLWIFVLIRTLELSMQVFLQLPSSWVSSSSDPSSVKSINVKKSSCWQQIWRRQISG